MIDATLIAGELFKDLDGKFRPGQEWSLEVTDRVAIRFMSFGVSAGEIEAAT